jgi:exosortase
MSKLNLNSNLRFLLFNALFVLAFFGPLRDLVQMSIRRDTFSYIPFIPFISAYLMYTDRQMIFTQKGVAPAAGSLPIGFGLLLLVFGGIRENPLNPNEYLTLVTSSMVLIWIGGFTLCYGIKSLREAVFPLIFLFFMVPIPDVLLDKIILFLQTGSAEAAYGFLQATGVPVTRDGFVFHLVTSDIEVAKECSGIRSSLSLVITGALAAKLFLRRDWTRILLMVSLVPIAILKNGFRIASLSILGVYVDERILESDLHRRGGIVFFVTALVLVWLVIVVLRRAEGRFHRLEKVDAGKGRV